MRHHAISLWMDKIDEINLVNNFIYELLYVQNNKLYI